MKLPMKRNNLFAIAYRGYSAKTSPNNASANSELKTTTLQNKLLVLSTNEKSPLSRISISFKGGSRYERADNFGITTVLRNSAGLANKRCSAFNIAVNLQEIGAVLTASAEREVFTYSVVVARENIIQAMKYLAIASTMPAFKPWELKDNLKHIETELSSVPPKARLIELLHQVAYRNGLGNSLYADKWAIKKIGMEHLQHYVRELFTNERSVVASVGVDHQFLVDFADSLELPSGNGPSAAPAKYFGGDVRSLDGGPKAHIAIAAEAPGFTKKDALVYGVLKNVLAGSVGLKYGVSQGTISQAVAKTGVSFDISGINVAYSDSGLVGFTLSASARDAPKAVEAAVVSLLSGNVTDNDVKRGKAQLKLDILAQSETSADALDSLIRQLPGGAVQTCHQLLAAVDAISAADVKAAAKKIASSKLSTAAVGNAIDVPFPDALAK